MDKKEKIIIIALIIIIAALLVAIVAVLPNLNKSDVNLKIVSNDTIYEGGKLSVKLTDSNNTPIANQTINIKLKYENGSVEQRSLTSDEKGCVNLKLDNAGNYTVNCTFEGSDKFKEASVSKQIEVLKQPVQQPTQASSSSNSIHYDSRLNVYYDSNGIVVDPDGKHPMGVGSRYEDLLADDGNRE